MSKFIAAPVLTCGVIAAAIPFGASLGAAGS